MRVTIDADRCQGHGRCYDLAPQIFHDDEEGYGQVTGDGTVPADLEPLAKRAAANCPERAISVAEGA